MQARYVPGSVEGIGEALAWAGLDYDYGDHTYIHWRNSAQRFLRRLLQVPQKAVHTVPIFKYDLIYKTSPYPTNGCLSQSVWTYIEHMPRSSLMQVHLPRLYRMPLLC